MRWLAACGVAVAAGDAAVTVGLGALDPGYSHVHQYISELGETGRPHATVFSAWCVAWGLLFAGFAVAAGRGLGSRAVRAALLAVAAASVAGGIFPCDPGCAGQTPAARLHFLAGYVGLGGTIAAPFLAWRVMRASPAWRGYRPFTLAVVVLQVAAVGWLWACLDLLDRDHAGCPVGAIQRLFTVIQYVWVVALAVRLWRDPQGVGRD